MDIQILNQMCRPLNDKPKQTYLDRYWTFVDKDATNGCWEWTGCKCTNGYGGFSVVNKMFKVHRLSWLIHYGDMPEIEGSDYRGTCVLHKCDNPSCVNPAHLFLGTHKENMTDMINKGRKNASKGEHRYNSKLTEKRVKFIRSWYSYGGITYKDIAAAYGLNETTVSRAINKVSWKHI